jgi:hypothetical protein
VQYRGRRKAPAAGGEDRTAPPQSAPSDDGATPTPTST